MLKILLQETTRLYYNIKVCIIGSYFVKNTMPCELNHGIQDKHPQLIGNMTKLHHPVQTTRTANLRGRGINCNKYTRPTKLITYSATRYKICRHQYVINTYTYQKHNQSICVVFPQNALQQYLFEVGSIQSIVLINAHAYLCASRNFFRRCIRGSDQYYLLISISDNVSANVQAREEPQ